MKRIICFLSALSPFLADGSDSIPTLPHSIDPAHDGSPSNHFPSGSVQWLSGVFFAGLIAGLLLFLLSRTRKTQSIDSKDLTSSQLGIIAVAVGAVLGFGGAMLSKHDPILDLIVAAVAAVLAIQLAETLRSSHLSKRMQSLERALESEVTFTRIDVQLNHLGRLSKVLHQHTKAAPLFEEFLAESYNCLNDNLDSLSAGTIHVNEPARELTFNKDCLQHLARGEVWAISYQDGPFWDEPEGRDFLELHEAKIKSGVSVHRIFLLTNKELTEQKAVIEGQIARGIHCRILLLESTSGREVQPEDFVLYDDTFVRAARLVAEGPTTTLKRAILTCDARKVRGYVQKRNDLKTRSEAASEVFARMTNSGGSANNPPQTSLPP